jgi:SnoaL-like domain
VHSTVARLVDAVNRHDPEAMAACFAPGYRSEQPVHPNRGFGGQDQVAANWRAMFAGVPDLTADVVAETSDGATSWVEMAWHGHHPDGSAFAMRGVTLMRVDDHGLIARARLYMEPVELDGEAIDDAVRSLAEPLT